MSDEVERAIGRLEGQAEAATQRAQDDATATQVHRHSVNNSLQTITSQLAVITQQVKNYGEIQVKHEGLEVRVRSMESLLAEQEGAGKLRSWIITVILAVFGGTVGMAIGRKIGLL